MSDAYNEATAAIERRRALVAAGTPGPWEDSQGHLLAPLYAGSRIAVRIASIFPSGNGPKPNTPLIVAAVNAFARDTDALEALLRHKPIATEPHGRLACEWCSDGLYAAWPCPDARAVLTALGVDHE